MDGLGVNEWFWSSALLECAGVFTNGGWVERVVHRRRADGAQRAFVKPLYFVTHDYRDMRLHDYTLHLPLAATALEFAQHIIDMKVFLAELAASHCCVTVPTATVEGGCVCVRLSAAVPL